MPPMKMYHEKDPKELIFEKIGDLSTVGVTFSQVLLGIYERPSTMKLPSGEILHIADQTREEDGFQGKAALVLKLGPLAFKDTAEVDFQGFKVEVGQWVVLRPSDGWPVSIHGVKCRMISDTAIRMVIAEPDDVW